MLTEKDIERLKEVFVTKEEMDKRFEQVDRRFEEMKGQLNEIMNSIDWLVKEYKKFDEERVIVANKVYDDHEKRIGAIENKLGMVV